MNTNEKFIAYAISLTTMSVCVEKDLTISEIEEAANKNNPTGITSKWVISKDKSFISGEPNPCPCNSKSDRLHYLLNC